MTTRTITDQVLIDDLEGGRARLLAGESVGDLLQVIRGKMESVTTNLYILRWIPEQGEDLFDVLVNGTSVVHVQIPRGGDAEMVFDVSPVEVYRRATILTKPDRRKLDLAIELARQS